MHLRWQVFEQKSEGLINGFAINKVIIVQDQDETILNGGVFIEKC